MLYSVIIFAIVVIIMHGMFHSTNSFHALQHQLYRCKTQHHHHHQQQRLCNDIITRNQRNTILQLQLPVGSNTVTNSRSMIIRASETTIRTVSPSSTNTNNNSTTTTITEIPSTTDIPATTNMLYIGNLNWNITTLVWEQRVRDAIGSFLSSTSSSSSSSSSSTTTFDTNHMNHYNNQYHTTTTTTSTSNIQIIQNIQFRNISTRQRDINKYHGGSMIITFNNTNMITILYHNLIHLQQQQQQQQQKRIFDSTSINSISSSSIQQQSQQPQSHWIVPLKIQYHYPPKLNHNTSNNNNTLQLSHNEIQQIRLLRAESYARRRRRIMNQTDMILNQLYNNFHIIQQPSSLSTTTTSSSFWMNAYPYNNITHKNSNNNFHIPTLVANELDWSIAPPMIDPAKGGGLHLSKGNTTKNHTQQQQSNKMILMNNQLPSSSSDRATRKRSAVETFLMILQHILSYDNKNNNTLLPIPSLFLSSSSSNIITIADLGCGSGNLALPLAWWLNYCNYNNNNNNYQNNIIHRSSYRILGIDLNTFSLQRLKDRVQYVYDNTKTMNHPLVETLELDLLQLINGNNNSNDDNTIAMANVSAIVSLHACGAASDLAIMAAVQRRIPFAISPCCIGKVLTVRSGLDDHNIDNNNNNTANSVNQVKPNHHKVPLTLPTQRGSTPMGTISYPRSQWFQEKITSNEYRLIASAADYGVRQSLSKSTNGKNNINNDDDDDEMKRWDRSRRAKRIVEMDRLQYAYEHGYYVRLFELPRIGPYYTKREILLGAIQNSVEAHRIATLPCIL